MSSDPSSDPSCQSFAPRSPSSDPAVSFDSFLDSYEHYLRQGETISSPCLRSLVEEELELESDHLTNGDLDLDLGDQNNQDLSLDPGHQTIEENLDLGDQNEDLSLDLDPGPQINQDLSLNLDLEPGPEFEQRGLSESEETIDQTAEDKQNESNSDDSFEKLEFMRSLGLRSTSLSVLNGLNKDEIQTAGSRNELSSLSDTSDLSMAENLNDDDQVPTTEAALFDLNMNEARNNAGANDVQDPPPSTADSNVTDEEMPTAPFKYEVGYYDTLRDLEDDDDLGEIVVPNASFNLEKKDNINVVASTRFPETSRQQNPVVSELMEKIDYLDREAFETLLCDKFASLASMSSKYSELEAKFSDLIIRKSQLEDEIQKKSEAFEQLERVLNSKPIVVKKSVSTQVNLPVETISRSTCDTSTSPMLQSDISASFGTQTEPQFILPDTPTNNDETEIQVDEEAEDPDVMILPHVEAEEPEVIDLEEEVVESPLLPAAIEAELPTNQVCNNVAAHQAEVPALPMRLRMVPMDQLLQRHAPIPSSSSDGVSPPPGMIPDEMLFPRPSPQPSPARRPRHPRPPRLPVATQNVPNPGNLWKKVPQKPDVTLSRQRGGKDVKVAWKIRSPQSCATISSFQIYEFHGKPEGEGPGAWRLIGDEPFDGNLSGVVTVKDFLPKTKYHFAVRAKDEHGRFGQFSDIREIKDIPK